MSPELRTRTLHYRKARYIRYAELANEVPLPNISLESAIIEALKIVKKRGEAVAREVNELNYIEQLDNAWGGFVQERLGHTGIIFTARSGDMVAAKGEGENGSTIILAQPKDSNNEPRDPATKIVYFAILGNHITYFSDATNADERLKDFINWLLKRKTNIISEFFGIEFDAKFPTNVRARILNHGVKQIHLNSQTDVTIINGLTDRLKSLIFDTTAQEGEAIVETPAERRAALNACHFSLSISTGKRDIGLKQEALAFYCSNLSDRDLMQMSLVLGDDSQVKQGELITTAKAEILYTNGVISKESARNQLVDWLIRLDKDKTIS